MPRPPSAARPQWVLVTPALAAANNGNWQTAARWSRMMRPYADVSVLPAWPGEAGSRLAAADQATMPQQAMVALHARRSAASIAAWRQRHPAAPLVVVLTGTDLYSDLPDNAAAMQSLALADRIIVLNDLAPQRVPQAYRSKVRVCLQSCSARKPFVPVRTQTLRALVVGHLRDEKAPDIVFRAVRLLQARSRHDIRIDHVGRALDAQLGTEAEALGRTHPTYRWLGDRPHADVRRRIQAADVLVHPSRMEGGAHVVIEAVRSGTPVLASAIDGNLGLLGTDWPASFPVGDASALATCLERARDEPGWLADLRSRATALAPRFDPLREAATLRRILDEAWAMRPGVS